LDRFYDLFEHNHLVWVTNPSIQDTTGVWRSVFHIVEDSTGHHLFGETYYVCLDVEMFMAPHFARSSTSSLYLVHHEGDVVLFTDVCDSLKEGWRSVIVSSFCLDRFRDDTCYWRPLTCRLGYKFFYMCQTSSVFSLILCLILLQWILVLGEVCLGPV